MTASKLPPEREDSIERKLIQFAEHAGWELLCKSSQGYRPGTKGHATTRITPGFPDLLFGHPGLKIQVYIEVKAEDGKLRQSQIAWHAKARRCGVRVWTIRSVSEFREQLIAYGWLSE